jgi:hypothetical protein
VVVVVEAVVAVAAAVVAVVVAVMVEEVVEVAVAAEACWKGGERSRVHWDSGETCLPWYWCSLGMRKHPG